MPSRAVTSFLPRKGKNYEKIYLYVSMPSRAVTSFLPKYINSNGGRAVYVCQCPLGLLPHFYLGNALTMSKTWKCVNALSGCYLISTYYWKRYPNAFYWMCQCPLGLLPHFYRVLCTASHTTTVMCVNALSGCYLISTVPLQKPRFYAASRACFCRYLSEYSDNSCFSCMLTIWTYFMRYTYP